MFTYIPELKRPELKLDKGDVLGNALYGYVNYDLVPRQVKNIFISTIPSSVWLETFGTWYEWEVGTTDTPEIIASKYYGDCRLYWVILLINNINNIYDEWPKDMSVLTRRMINEYGDILTPQQTVHHYEHKTQKYIISDTTYKFIEKTKKNEYVSVSEYEFMVNTNEKNRKIRLIRPRYINDFILEFQNTVQLFK